MCNSFLKLKHNASVTFKAFASSVRKGHTCVVCVYIYTYKQGSACCVCIYVLYIHIYIECVFKPLQTATARRSKVPRRRFLPFASSEGRAACVKKKNWATAAAFCLAHFEKSADPATVFFCWFFFFFGWLFCAHLCTVDLPICDFSRMRPLLPTNCTEPTTTKYISPPGSRAL